MKIRKRRRGGLPSRVRAAILVRVDPDVATYLEAEAKHARRSRSALCEGILTSVVRALDDSARAESSPQMLPEDVIAVLGRSVARELFDLGVLSKYAASAFEEDGR